MIPRIEAKDEGYLKPQPSKKRKIESKCYHGFVVYEHKQSPKIFPMMERISVPSKSTLVYRSICPENGCDLVVKRHNLKEGENSSKAFLKEIDALKFFSENESRHVVEYYGSLKDDNFGYIFMEQGEYSLDRLLSEQGSLFSIEQFNETLFQLFELVEDLHELEFQPYDFKTQNMIFCKNKEIIKLIDFEFYAKSINDKGKKNRDYSSALFLLPNIGETLFELQLSMFVKNETERKRLFSEFKKYILCGEINKKKVEEVLGCNDLWNPRLDSETKNMIISCFFQDSRQSIKERINFRMKLVAKRHQILESLRKSLV